MAVRFTPGMRITPTRANAVSAIVTRAGAQSVASGGSGAAISFDAEESDVDNMWTSGNPTRINCTVAGNYLVSGGLIFAGNITGVRSAVIYRNGSLVQELKRSASNPLQADPVSVTGVFALAVGDYIELWAYQNSGVALNVTVSRLAVTQVAGV